MNIKCHWCSSSLKNGRIYSLECTCGFCNITFDKYGEPTIYKFQLFENGTDYLINKHYKGDTYLYEIKKSYKPIIKAKCILKFEDDVPQVYKIYEKLKTYILFS